MLYRDFEDDSDQIRKVPSEQNFAVELQVPSCRQVSTVGNLRSRNLNGENDRNISCLAAVLPPLDAEMSTSAISPQMLSPYNSPASASSAPLCHFKQSKRETDNTSVVASVISRSVRADINALLSSEIEFAKIGPSIPLSEQAIYVVSFKRSTRDFTLHTRVPTVINSGDAVVVSAERAGMDLGTVCICTIITIGENMSTRFPGLDISAPPPPGKSKFNIKKHTGKLVRIATAREQRMLVMKELEEQKVSQSCTHILHAKYHLPLTLVDVEYQFDRHKITLYYRPLGRLDFKQFVEEVSAVHNARIWMEAVV